MAPWANARQNVSSGANAVRKSPARADQRFSIAVSSLISAVSESLHARVLVVL